MIRAIGYLISEALWTLVFKLAPQRFEQDDDPQTTADATAVRTEWIQKNRPLNGGWR